MGRIRVCRIIFMSLFGGFLQGAGREGRCLGFLGFKSLYILKLKSLIFFSVPVFLDQPLRPKQEQFNTCCFFSNIAMLIF